MKTSKKVKKSRRRNYSLLAVGILLIIVILAAAFYIFWLNFFVEKPETSESKSNANIAIIAEARAKNDPSICERISGGIIGKSGKSVQINGANFDTFGRPARTESEAKAQCVRASQNY